MCLSFSTFHFIKYFFVSIMTYSIHPLPFCLKVVTPMPFLKNEMRIEYLSRAFSLQKLTTSDTANFERIDSITCRCSSWIFISRISSLCLSQSCFYDSLNRLFYCPLRILNRYLGHHTIWYLHCQIACANLLNLLTEYLLLMFRATILHLNEVFFYANVNHPLICIVILGFTSKTGWLWLLFKINEYLV
jgi:hypothetical protein